MQLGSFHFPTPTSTTAFGVGIYINPPAFTNVYVTVDVATATITNLGNVTGFNFPLEAVSAFDPATSRYFNVAFNASMDAHILSADLSSVGPVCVCVPVCV